MAQHDTSKEDGLTLLWVAFGTSGYKETALANYQAVNDPKNPLKERARASMRRS